MPYPSYVVYVNTAVYKNKRVAKIGISNNPQKRLWEYNNGLRHLRKNGYISERVFFSPYFNIPVSGKEQARSLESDFLRQFKDYVVRDLGKEVVLFPAELAAVILCGLANARGAK